MLISLGQNIILVFAITFIYSALIPQINKSFDWIASGLLFGGIGIVAMQTPIEVIDGVIIDARVIIVTCAALFGGFKVGFMAAFIVSTYRYHLGGLGAETGIMVILSVAAIGSAFRYYYRDTPAHYTSQMKVLLLSIIVAIQSMLWTFALPIPFDDALIIFKRIFLPVGVAYPAGILLLTYLISREFRHRDMSWASRFNEQRLKAITEALPDFAFVLNKEGRYIEVIASNTDRLFAIPQKLKGQLLVDVLPANVASSIFQTVQLTIETNKPQTLEYILEVPAGKRWFEGRTSLIRDTKDDDPLVLWYAFDITQRKTMEETSREREVLYIMLEKEKELSELKSRFITMISHEFRTPLASILSSSEMLQRYGDKMDTYKKIQRHHKIELQVKHMVKMLDEILAIEQPDQNKPNPAYFNLSGMVGEVIDQLAQIRSQYQIVFHMEGDCQQVYLDQRYVRQIFQNLLENAITYSSADKAITLNLYCNTAFIIIRVQDQGMGIATEDQDKVFNPFHRAKNVQNIGGTGLGLTIVKNCVDACEGDIKVESELNIGTTFTVKLPIW